MRLISVLLLATSALAAGSASAQIRVYCCDDAKSRKVCADYLPPECQGRAYEERDGKGRVSKLVEAPLTPEQQARRVAETAQKEAAAKKAAEERRRTLALMSTYSSAKDIDSARDRALREMEKNLLQIQQRLDDAKKKQKRLEGEKEFYKGKPLPEQVKSQIRDNENEIKAQAEALETKTKEMDEVRARFADEKKRYLELTGKPMEPPEAKAATPTPPATPAAPAKPEAKK